MPRRARRTQDVIRDFRRDQIINTARRLFGERGTTDVPMDEIAAEAGVARSTVYVYFANRDELLQACVQSMYDRLQETIGAVVVAGDTPPLERLRVLILGVLERIDESPDFFRLAMATQATTGSAGSAAVGGTLMLIGLDMIRVLEELISRRHRSGRVPPRPRPRTGRGARGPADLRCDIGALRRAGSDPGGAGGRRDLRLRPTRTGGMT